MEKPQQGWAELLERVRRRDAAAAEALVEALYPVVMRVLHRRMPRGSDARDLAQEVMLRILEGVPSFRGGGDSLPGWAGRIAFRTCLNEWRRRKRRPEVLWADLTEEQAAWLAGGGGGVSSSGPATDTLAARELVGLLLSQLAPEERYVIELAELEGRGADEIRELTGWSAMNLRVRRFRARRKLRQALRKLKFSRSHE